MKPTAVESGEAALDRADERGARCANPYSLILLDANMPDMDGFAVAARVAERADAARHHDDDADLVRPAWRPGRYRELGIRAT